jgi:peptidoglycan/xylan/chitin deacetylase (PgdA/CDA1 family)
MRDTFRTIRHAVLRRPEPAILMYHRVAEPPCDPWGLSVEPRRFEQQMRILKASRVPLPMTEFVGRLEKGTLPALAVGITFDDGYIDNLTVAKPILEAMGIPATIFLATGFLGSGKEFWWDELARMTLCRSEPADGTVLIGERPIAITLPPLPGHPKVRSTWRAWDPPRTERERLYLELWGAVRRLRAADREAAMSAVRDLLGQGTPEASDFPMRPQDVASLLAGGAIDIGAHSRTHPSLPTVAIAEKREEIEGSRVDCEALVGNPVHSFAYPHGERDKVTKDLLSSCGFQWACSTDSAAVDRNRFDRFDLPRLQVMNWTSQELSQALSTM